MAMKNTVQLLDLVALMILQAALQPSLPQQQDSTTEVYKLPRMGGCSWGFPSQGGKERPCLSTQTKEKARFPTSPIGSCPNSPVIWKHSDQGPTATRILTPRGFAANPCPHPCLTAQRRRGYLCMPKAFEKQVVILAVLFKMETVPISLPGFAKLVT